MHYSIITSSFITYLYLFSVVLDGAVEHHWSHHTFPHRELITALGRDALYRDGVCDVG